MASSPTVTGWRRYAQIFLKQKALDWLTEQVDIVDDEGQPIDRADLEPLPGEEESDE